MSVGCLRCGSKLRHTRPCESSPRPFVGLGSTQVPFGAVVRERDIRVFRKHQHGALMLLQTLPESVGVGHAPTKKGGCPRPTMSDWATRPRLPFCLAGMGGSSRWPRVRRYGIASAGCRTRAGSAVCVCAWRRAQVCCRSVSFRQACRKWFFVPANVRCVLPSMRNAANERDER